MSRASVYSFNFNSDNINLTRIRTSKIRISAHQTYFIKLIKSSNK